MPLPTTQDNQLSEEDGRYMRLAIDLSRTARERGNRPFGSIIVAHDGQILAEAANQTSETGDCTAHAETAAIRIASPLFSRDVMAGATIYASGEPCVMCAGAIFWANIQRVVFGIDAERLRVFRGERLEQRDAALSCRDVFAAATHPIQCIGPVMVDEASAPHAGFWKT